MAFNGSILKQNRVNPSINCISSIKSRYHYHYISKFIWGCILFSLAKLNLWIPKIRANGFTKFDLKTKVIEDKPITI